MENRTIQEGEEIMSVLERSSRREVVESSVHVEKCRGPDSSSTVTAGNREYSFR